MKKILVNNTMNLILKYNSYPEEKIDSIKYGIETIYLTTFKTILFIILSMILRDTKELFIFIFTYSLLKLNAFGAHAKKSSHCWIFSSIFFIEFPLIIKYTLITKSISIITSIIYIVLLSIYAPADTEKRPLTNNKKRLRYKMLTIITSIIYYIVIIFTNNLIIINSLYLSLLLETILVLPISYKVLGVKYSNYLKYKNKERK